MGHNVGKVAERAVASSQQKLSAVETPEQIFKFLRANTISDQPNLSIPPDKVRWLLDQYDQVVLTLSALQEKSLDQARVILSQVEQIEQFRTVYEQENRSQDVSLFLERAAPNADHDVHRFDDDGGAVQHPDAK